MLGLQTQAVTRALADAGLSLRDVDGLATTGVARFSATSLAEHLGLQPAWTDSTFAGGSAFEMFVARAAQAIEAGQCHTVVISFASNQRSARSRSLGGVYEAHTPEAQFEAAVRPALPGVLLRDGRRPVPAPLRRHDRDALAEVAVAAREWALLNPAAFRYDAGPLTIDDVLNAKLVSTPLGVADCCLVTDGGGAVVLTSLERARDLPKPPIVVLGYGESTTNSSMTAVDDLTVTGAVASGAAAFGRAGLTPADVDVAQLYDSFTITVLLTLEALGFCGRARRRLRPGGRSGPAAPAAEHLRRRALLLPPRPVRRAAARRGGPPAARRVRRPPGRRRRGGAGARHRRHPVHARHRPAGGGPMNAATNVAEHDEVDPHLVGRHPRAPLLVQECGSCGHTQHPPRACAPAAAAPTRSATARRSAPAWSTPAPW